MSDDQGVGGEGTHTQEGSIVTETKLSGIVTRGGRGGGVDASARLGSGGHLLMQRRYVGSNAPVTRQQTPSVSSSLLTAPSQEHFWF